MTETTNPRIEQMHAALSHALAALETAENREGPTRAMWQTASDNALRLASTLALASIAETLAALVGIAVQAEDELNRIHEAVDNLADVVNVRLTAKTGEDVADLLLRYVGVEE